MTSQPPTCPKCGSEMRELPHVIGGWPAMYFCPSQECAQGGMLVVDLREVQDA